MHLFIKLMTIFTVFTHLRIPNKSMKVDVCKRDGPRELNAHHHHTCHPEEQYVMPVWIWVHIKTWDILH